VVAGWGLERIIHDLRGPRNDRTDAVLLNTAPSASEIQSAEEARSTFARWHLFSLLLNFVTLVLATVALAMAAKLPEAVGDRQTASLDQKAATVALDLEQTMPLGESTQRGTGRDG
jgi:hypothetical protein